MSTMVKHIEDITEHFDLNTDQGKGFTLMRLAFVANAHKLCAAFDI